MLDNDPMEVSHDRWDNANPHYVFLFIATHIYKYIEFIYNG